MAKPKPKPAEEKKGGGVLSAIIAITLASVCAGGIGFLSGTQARQMLGKSEAGAAVVIPAKIEKDTVQMMALPPIVTNLTGSEGGWVRLEAAVLVEGKQAIPADLPARLAQDITALLRTLSLQQISGASGFQHLRGDLMDRMKTRSADRVREILIQSLVIE